MGITRHPLFGSDPSGRVDSVPLDLKLIGRLESSFERVSAAGDAFPKRFYETLFAAHPEVRRLFPADLALQRQKLLDMLRWVVGTLRDPAAVRTQLAELGARHVTYGARAEHYPAIVRALVEAMAQISGPQWSEDLRADWTSAFELVSDIMLGGAAASGAKPTGKADGSPNRS